MPAPHDADPLANDAALQAGPGSARLTSNSRRSSSRSLSQLQWVVGCDGDVRAGSQSAVDRTEVAAKNGDLEELVGVPVLGWHITQVKIIVIIIVIHSVVLAARVVFVVVEVIVVLRRCSRNSSGIGTGKRDCYLVIFTWWASN